ncbi:hypothetical protein BJF79_31805 [Actinomadura sp. CNU-125]|uniref:DUF4232 domain-containing protein n=1 Tax=Actinomadura sp. CNU-125 TaxID=1904961 RepID=UPI00095D20BE|nr:DUF4232 domain-containing protein [Actinomadura sp. CNU-125]OLT35903.1 hypothetical protein BJF79_31805 [Actinomadura sp. CNU-125]
MPRFFWGTLAAAAIATGAAGCGSTSDAGTASADGGTSAQASASANESTSQGEGSGEGAAEGAGESSPGGTSGSPGSGGSEGSGGAAPCTSSMLSATLTDLGAGAGQRYATLVISNRSGDPCTTGGWAGLQQVRGNETIPTRTVRRGDAETITIPPKTSAYERLHWAAVPADDETGSGGCEPVPTELKVIPPNQTSQITATWDGGPVCQHGEIELEPLTLTEPA